MTNIYVRIFLDEAIFFIYSQGNRDESRFNIEEALRL